MRKTDIQTYMCSTNKQHNSQSDHLDTNHNIHDNNCTQILNPTKIAHLAHPHTHPPNTPVHILYHTLLEEAAFS